MTLITLAARKLTCSLPIVVLTTIGLVAGCQPGQPRQIGLDPPTGSITALNIVPRSLTLVVGAAGLLQADGTLSDGTQVANVPVTWTAAGGTITAGGLYTAGLSLGTFQVIATQQGGTTADTSLVTISATTATLLQLVFSPASLTLASGATGQFTVAGTWSDGSATIPAVTYSATGGTITLGGLYTAGSTPGMYRVIATEQGGSQADTSSITITPQRVAVIQVSPSPDSIFAGQTVQLSATLRDVNGVVLMGRLVTWASTDPLVATVSPTGLVTANSVGNARVSATSEGVVQSTGITVQTTLFSEGFESGTLDSLLQVGCCAYSASVQQSVRRSGLSSARVEARATDPITGASHRSELRITSGSIVGGVGSERWYGLSIYIPSNWQVDANPEDYQILAQWHNLPDTELGEGYTPPPLAIWIDKGEWSIWSYWDPNSVTQLVNGAPASPGGRAVLWRGAFVSGRWTDWVVHVKWSYGAGGLLEIWKDGQLVVSRTGPNTYNDIRPLYFMAGIYKWMWDTPGLVWSQPTRVAYFDEFRIVGHGGSYAAVAPR